MNLQATDEQILRCVAEIYQCRIVDEDTFFQSLRTHNLELLAMLDLEDSSLCLSTGQHTGWEYPFQDDNDAMNLVKELGYTLKLQQFHDVTVARVSTPSLDYFEEHGKNRTAAITKAAVGLWLKLQSRLDPEGRIIPR